MNVEEQVEMLKNVMDLKMTDCRKCVKQCLKDLGFEIACTITSNGSQRIKDCNSEGWLYAIVFSQSQSSTINYIGKTTLTLIERFNNHDTFSNIVDKLDSNSQIEIYVKEYFDIEKHLVQHFQSKGNTNYYPPLDQLLDEMLQRKVHM